MHNDSDIRPPIVTSRVGMTTRRTSEELELGGIDLHRLFLQPIFDLDKNARNDVAAELLIPENDGYIEVDHALAVCALKRHTARKRQPSGLVRDDALVAAFHKMSKIDLGILECLPESCTVRHIVRSGFQNLFHVVTTNESLEENKEMYRLAVLSFMRSL